MSTAISVENVSKSYRLGALGGATLKEDFARWWAKRRGRTEQLVRIGEEHRARHIGEEFWALQDISFKVREGETLGIIGRNGAGKSTLLKVLSQVASPTSGEVKIKGRIASLLEVGTGFHPELTGRENVFLNGAILGMTRAEIRGKFDEIVAFSGIEEFIDTPVKRYSSGMYVRLAFAVAAHLEPEILIIDEVLAVGDAEFQKRCLGKMEDASKKQGRTVLFVSHSMAAVSRLCARCILVDGGRVKLDGPAQEVTSAYLTSDQGISTRRDWLQKPGSAPGNKTVRLRSVGVRTRDGNVRESVPVTAEVGIEMTFEVLQPGQVLVPNYHFFNGEGICLFVLHDWESEWRDTPRPVGTHVSTAWIPKNFLNEGEVIVGVAISTYKPFQVHFYEREVVSFQVVDVLDQRTSRGDSAGHIPGAVRPIFRWTNSHTAAASADISLALKP